MGDEIWKFNEVIIDIQNENYLWHMNKIIYIHISFIIYIYNL